MKNPPILALCVFCLLAVGQARADDPPNIVLIISDDHGYPHFGFMQDHLSGETKEALKIPSNLDEFPLTPNLDAIAARGTMFPVAHNVASICKPSLAGLMTGRMLPRIVARGDRVDPDPNGDGVMDTIAGFLTEAGYQSYGIGKNWERHWKEIGFTDGWPNFEYSHDVTRETRQPIFDFIDQSEADGDPWFVWYAPYLPHSPFTAGPDYVDQFKDLDVGGTIKKYFGMIAWLDDTVGEIDDFLADRGLADNTIIVFLTDNGARMPGGAKGNFKENGYRTPVIVAGPGIEPQVRDEMAHSIDILPTLLSLAGLPPFPTDALGGRDLTPILRGENPPWRDYLFGVKATSNGGGYHQNSKNWYVRTTTGLWVASLRNGDVRVFDLTVDPTQGSRIDLSDRPDLVGEVDAAITALVQWHAAGSTE